MPRIDRFLTAMVQHGADALCLGAGLPVQLSRGGQLQPVTKDILTEVQVTALLREIAPPTVAPQVGSGSRLNFDYASPVGPIAVSLGPDGGGSTATLRPAAAPATSNAGAAPVAARGPAPRNADARAEMERLLRRLVESGGSDLHLRSGAIPQIRKDGGLLRLDEPELSGDRMEELLRSIMLEEVYEGFLRDNDQDFAWEIAGLARFRCNAGRDRHGAIGVFRQIPSDIKTVEDLGLLREIQNLCHLNRGLVVVTGPTGSGKSTTLAAMVDLINRSRSDHLITIEDPIEFVHQSKRCLVTQRQVGIHTKSFKAALRAALREDPDVILVGEMRDLETISIAIETAETGHLVLGTLHTTTAASPR